MDKLTKVQKWAMRTISCSHYRSHTGPIFAKFRILTVTDMYALELGTFMFKYSVNELPLSFKNFFTKRSEIHNYSTRHNSNYNLTKNRRTFSDKSVRTTGPHLWNSLNIQLKNSNSIKHFRSKMKNDFILNYV